MRAVFIRDFGGPECLEIREVADPPEPSGDQVLIRVKAAALNRADLFQRRGRYPAPEGYSTNIPGLEFAGEIAESGKNVEGFRAGDRVFGITAGEAQAEYLIAHESTLVRIPANLSFIEAAAIPEAFITAHDAIFTLGSLQKGETILIHAVGSGVGLAALQMARSAGACVIGTSRTKEKLERCGEFGLDEGILIERDSGFAELVTEKTNGGGANVILDLVGAAYFPENLKSLALLGRLILVGLPSGAVSEFNMAMALQKRLTLVGTVLRSRSIAEKAEATRRFAAEYLLLIESGEIRPNVDRIFPFYEVRSAHEYLESNESFGKVILEF